MKDKVIIYPKKSHIGTPQPSFKVKKNIELIKGDSHKKYYTGYKKSATVDEKVKGYSLGTGTFGRSKSNTGYNPEKTKIYDARKKSVFS